MEKKNYYFIDIVDHTGRTSALGVNMRGHEDGLEIIGGLPHCYSIQPKNSVEANKLIAWLEEWKKKNSH